ncbi:MAG: hypothetical protein ABL957_10235 [Parvularculaceae bacterium]
MSAAVRAKCYRIAFVAALALTPALAPACAGLERFAPPGIVKYEDLAGDKPQNEQITARAAEIRGSSEAEFPNLSAAPQAPPETLDPAVQASLETDLAGARETLNASVAVDRTDVAAGEAAAIALPGVIDAPAPLAAVRDALNAAVADDDAAARAGRGLPPRTPPAE